MPPAWEYIKENANKLNEIKKYNILNNKAFHTFQHQVETLSHLSSYQHLQGQLPSN